MSELPQGWAEATIGDLFLFNYGKSLPAADRKEGPFSVYGSNGKVGTHTHAVTNAPVIVVGRKGSIGEVHFSAEPCFPIDTTYYIDNFSGFDPHFVNYLFRSLPFTEMNRATAIPGLSREDVYSVHVPVPPLPEQERIVTKVDRLTARTARARADLDRIPTLIARYKQRLLSLAFSGELTAGWRASKNLPEPKPASLSDILAIPVRNGLSVRGSDDPPGVRALRLSALRGAEVNLNDVRYLPISPQQASRFLLNEGDILISRGNGTRAFVGIGSRVPALTEDTIFPDTAFRIRLEPDCALSRWFVSIWNSPQVRSQIEDAAKTTAGIWKVAQSDLARIQILLPTTDEQAEITRRIESSFNWLDRMAADHASAANLVPKLDAAILAKAFRGGLVPQDPTDEPASTLLERIRMQSAETPAKARRKRTETATMATAPKPDLLTDSLSWPSEGLAFDAISQRLSVPYEHLKEAVFAALGGEEPELVQAFDAESRTIRLKRAKP